MHQHRRCSQAYLFVFSRNVHSKIVFLLKAFWQTFKYFPLSSFWLYELDPSLSLVRNNIPKCSHSNFSKVTDVFNKKVNISKAITSQKLVLRNYFEPECQFYNLGQLRLGDLFPTRFDFSWLNVLSRQAKLIYSRIVATTSPSRSVLRTQQSYSAS